MNGKLLPSQAFVPKRRRTTVSISAKEQDEFRAEVFVWFTEKKPVDPGSLFPQNFMKVGTDK